MENYRHNESIKDYRPIIEKVDDIFSNKEFNRENILNVIAYNENVKAFTSFYSTNPVWVMDIFDNMYSIDKYNMLRVHNRKPQYDKSKIVFSVNKYPTITKVFDNVEYYGEFDPFKSNFTRINFSTKNMLSRDVDIIGNREDNYRFAIPRTIARRGELFPNRMKGRYMISNYEFDNPNSKFRVSAISTKFRQSYI